MRSEHNGGASLAAFLLAVSTVTLLMVSPVEGQECTTNADCGPAEPFCDVPEGATEGECGACIVSAFPGAAGSCPDIPVGVFAGPQLCGRRIPPDPGETFCYGCARLVRDGTTSAADCETVLAAPPFNQSADVVANCQRGCFGFYACDTNADCPDALPYCDISSGATEGECSSNCVVTAFPGETGSCGGAELCNIGIDAGNCEACPTSITLDDCETVFAGYGADQIANCQRSCFNFYACATNADCPDTLPFCNLPQGATEGECVATDPSECVVSVFPGETGSCPDPDEACIRTTTTAPKTVCVPCTLFEQDFGITTAADCGFLENPPANQTADVVANCQRECFGFYACTSEADCPADRPLCDAGQCLAECGTNADCPADRPICNAGQCEISVFSPLDGMGGGSSA